MSKDRTRPLYFSGSQVKEIIFTRSCFRCFRFLRVLQLFRFYRAFLCPRSEEGYFSLSVLPLMRVPMSIVLLPLVLIVEFFFSRQDLLLVGLAFPPL